MSFLGLFAAARPIDEPAPPCPWCASALCAIDPGARGLWLCESCDLTMRRH